MKKKTRKPLDIELNLCYDIIRKVINVMSRNTLMIFNVKTCLYSLLFDSVDVYHELKETYPELTIEIVRKIQDDMVKEGKLRINRNHMLSKFVK